MDKQLERSNKERVLRRLAKQLEPAGFRRTKPTFFTRTSLPVIEFIHLHKFTFDSSFRVHMGLRVVNDPFVAIALNGPDSDAHRLRYDLRYHEDEESIDRCTQNIAAFMSVVARPWFESWRDRRLLACSSRSPLAAEARAALVRALAGVCEEQYVSKTRELLNVP
jgi:hypothetical protein